jgi:hypothetical protein
MRLDIRKHINDKTPGHPDLASPISSKLAAALQCIGGITVDAQEASSMVANS